jgi:hypothetical protein
MCFKKKQPTEIVQDITDNTVIEIVCGDYQGTDNDLNGPPNDLIDYKNSVSSLFPQYTFRQFKDSKATTGRFTAELRSVVNRMKSGDLLFFVMDNCFSESNTRGIGSPAFVRSRVYHNPKYPAHKSIVNKVLSNTDGLNYISMSACLDHETAADAVFNRRANGAYTYCLNKTLEIGITYREWDQRAGEMLKRLGFNQTCTIEGPDHLLDRKVFEGTVYNMYVSSHGSHRYDTSGDEGDQQDEGPYLYDGFLPDDNIAIILSDLPE